RMHRLYSAVYVRRRGFAATCTFSGSTFTCPSMGSSRLALYIKFRDSDSCHRELNNPHLEELKIPHSSFARRERNVDGERDRGRDHRSGRHPTPGGADGRSRALGGDSPAVAQRAAVDRSDRAATGAGSEDGPALSAGNRMDRLSAPAAVGHPAGPHAAYLRERAPRGP